MNRAGVGPAASARRAEIGRAAAPVLLVNPEAGRLGGSVRDGVVERVRDRLGADIFTTEARDQATLLAGEAASAGAPFVIAFGGDGHVNEVANGIVGSDCALAVLPGGTMNVFARALGIPRDPPTAVDYLLAALDRPMRRVNLGRVDDRYFLVSAGCGFDAEAAELVDRDLASKRRFGELFFYWSAFRVLAGAYRHRKPNLTLRGPFGEIPAAMAIVNNTGPYAYLAGRPVVLAPNVRLDGGLDVLALRSMRIEALPLYIWRTVVTGDFAHHGDAFYRSDLESLEVVSSMPFHRHVDGEPLPPTTSARFSLAPDALEVLA